MQVMLATGLPGCRRGTASTTCLHYWRGNGLLIKRRIQLLRRFVTDMAGNFYRCLDVIFRDTQGAQALHLAQTHCRVFCCNACRQ
jgi:hypothetical protein